MLILFTHPVKIYGIPTMASVPQALKQIQNYSEELEHLWNESTEKNTFDKSDG